jgi:hypothetical protein
MDSGGTTIEDTGNSLTSRTETIDSQYNNRDLYWGVRTANPLSPIWSVRRFRIEPQSPSCNPNANQVGLYTDANFGGSCVVKDVGNYSNPSAMGIANDSISSVKVGGNVKLTLCQNDDYSGTCEVFTGDDSNLSDNSIGDNQASSAKVETRNSCTNGAISGALQPGYASCANEGGTCTFSGQASVAYGANNCYFYQTFTSSISCGNGTFGDPLVGAGKACYFKILTPPPSANFDAWPQSGIAPLTSTMHIVDTSNITSCSWTYGDGQTGTSCASTHDHTYTNAGTYSVSLTVSGPGGTDSMTRNNYIVASPQPLPDLVPYPLSGDGDPIVISRTTGNSNQDTLISGQPAYIDWGYKNIGQGDAGPHHVKIWIDSQLYIDYGFNGLGAGSLGGFDDWEDDNIIAPGAHTVTMTVDANNDVNESNESNNNWSGTFNWRAPTVQLNSVFTTDELGAASLETSSKTKAGQVHADALKDIFNLGDPIGLYLDITNDFLTSQDVSAEWQVLNPAGRTVPDLSWSGTTSLGPGEWWWWIVPTIPNYIPRGEYTFIGKVTYNGDTTTQTHAFTVNGSVTVEVYDAFTADADGNISAQGVVPKHMPASDLHTTSVGTFNAGDGIQLYIDTYNDFADGETAAFQWTITDPWGRPIPSMEWSGDLNSSLGYTWWYLPTTIPSDAITGDYTFTGIITHGGRTTYQTAIFHVNGPASPTNDDISASTVISSVPYNVQLDTWGATVAANDPIPSCGNGQNSNSVWYRYTPAANGILHVDTQDSDYDTVIAIWTGSAGNLSEVFCNNDSFSTTQSWLETALTHSTAYYIEVMDFGGPGGGNLNLNVDFATSVDNDDFNTPTNITSTSFSTAHQDTRAATQATDDPDLTQCNRLAGLASVWYRYTPATSGILRLDTDGSDYDTMLAVWSGTRGSLTPLDCNDDIGMVNGNWDLNSALAANLSAGIPYYIEVSNYNGFIDINSASLAAQENKPEISAQYSGGQMVLHSLFTACYSLNYGVSPNGAGSVGVDTAPNCSGSLYTTGTIVQLTASANTGYAFNSWSGSATGSSNPLSMAMTAAKSVTASFTLKKYTLSVSKAGNGSGTVTSNPAGINCGTTCSASFDYGSPITLTAVAATGSTFTGWDNSGCPGTGTCTVYLSAAGSVAANFTLNTYLLSVGKTGTGSGTLISSPAGINCGTTCSASFNYKTSVTLTAAAATGSSFTGWSGSGCSGTGTCTVSMIAAESVTANFTLKKYTLSVVKTGNGSGTVTSAPEGINCGTTCSASFNYNSPITLTAVAATGSTFTGWNNSGCPGTGTCTVYLSAAGSVTANFTLNTYLLSVSKTGTGSGTLISSPAGISCGVTCSATFNYNTSVTLIATAATGSIFTGWSGGGCSGTGICRVTMIAAGSVTANFTLNTYLLSVSKAGIGNGTVTSAPAGVNCGATCSASFNYNTSLTLSATAATGSTFTGWSGSGCSGTGTCTVVMTAAKSVTANFSLNKYALSVGKTGTGSGTVTSSPAGINCGATCSVSFNYNTSVTLSATAATGSTFTGWSGNGCSGTGTCTVIMTAAESVTANFTLNTYLLSVGKTGIGSGTLTSAPAGINCGATCSALFNYNTSVTLTATAATGSTFTGWSGSGCLGTGTCTVVMTAAKSVTANFTLKKYTLSVVKTGNGSGTVTSVPAGINCGTTCSASFNYNSPITLTAVAATGSSFTGWNNSGCPGTGTCTVYLSAAGSVAANFTLKTYALSVSKAGTGHGSVTSAPAGISCGATCSASFNYNTSVTLTATASTGSTFTGWSGACTGTGTCNVTMSAAKSVTATFQLLPGAFGKTSPANLATGLPNNPTLSWAASTGAKSDEYCLSTTSCTTASTWVSTGSATSKAFIGLTPGTKYYWQVRARNASGITYANGNLTAAWSFTVTQKPGAFNKTSPANAATNQLTSPTLKWGSALTATRYEYCYDTTNDNLCSIWTSTGTTTSKTLSGLKPYTTYYWQVRAVNSFGTTYANSGTYWSFKIVPLSASFQSVGRYDGWVLESSAGSGVGGSLDAISQYLRLGDNGLNRQYRAILSFDTTSLPNTAVIIQVTLKVMQQSIAGTNPFTALGALNVDIRKPFFGTTVGLAASDFQATASKVGVGTLGITPVSMWYMANLGSSANPYVNLSGTTQFRLRFATASNKNGLADYVNLYSGDATTASDRPVLIIQYYLP